MVKYRIKITVYNSSIAALIMERFGQQKLLGKGKWFKI